MAMREPTGLPARELTRHAPRGDARLLAGSVGLPADVDQLVFLPATTPACGKKSPARMPGLPARRPAPPPTLMAKLQPHLHGGYSFCRNRMVLIRQAGPHQIVLVKIEPIHVLTIANEAACTGWGIRVPRCPSMGGMSGPAGHKCRPQPLETLDSHRNSTHKKPSTRSQRCAEAIACRKRPWNPRIGGQAIPRTTPRTEGPPPLHAALVGGRRRCWCRPWP